MTVLIEFIRPTLTRPLRDRQHQPAMTNRMTIDSQQPKAQSNDKRLTLFNLQPDLTLSFSHNTTFFGKKMRKSCARYPGHIPKSPILGEPVSLERLAHKHIYSRASVLE
jgi:hypothetical protein